MSEGINLDKGAIGVLLVGDAHDALGGVGIGAGKPDGASHIGLVVGKIVAAQLGVEDGHGILAAVGNQGSTVGTSLETIVLAAVAVPHEAQQSDEDDRCHNADDEVAVEVGLAAIVVAVLIVVVLFGLGLPGILGTPLLLLGSQSLLLLPLLVVGHGLGLLGSGVGTGNAHGIAGGLATMGTKYRARRHGLVAIFARDLSV